MKRVIIFWFGLTMATFLVSACAPSEAERQANATAFSATSDAIKQSRFMTQTAAPTRTPPPPQTPLPTQTPDTRSDFEKCAQSGFGVRYVITGWGPSAGSLTWENDTGGTNQGDYKIPVCITYDGFQRGDFLYISAQIIGNGRMTCQIFDGETLIAEAEASGNASIATCSGSAK